MGAKSGTNPTTNRIGRSNYLLMTMLFVERVLLQLVLCPAREYIP